MRRSLGQQKLAPRAGETQISYKMSIKHTIKSPFGRTTFLIKTH
jgi:hypothetical protein